MLVGCSLMFSIAEGVAGGDTFASFIPAPPVDVAVDVVVDVADPMTPDTDDWLWGLSVPTNPDE